jgi:hypothetical protein
MNALKKFQDLLRDIFQFESSDLDFGIYRILESFPMLGCLKQGRDAPAEGLRGGGRGTSEPSLLL